jgi:ribosome-associated protein
MSPMDAKKLALLCRELADNKKAENIEVIEVKKVSSICDYFVIATGTSEPHLRAIADEITDRLSTEHGREPMAVDGTAQTSWVVVDYFDVIVHVMRQEVRERYNLETLWGEVPRLKPRRAKTKAAAKKPAPEE